MWRRVLIATFQVIPRAIDYFTGKALEWEDDDGEDNFDDDDEFDEDDEDEDANDSDDDVPASRRKSNKGNNVDAQECKQQ